jgi:hypothetical protein
MTIAKDFAAKASVAFVAAAMIFGMFAPSAKAQSAEDLQKMINDLLAQIASLQSQVGQGGSSAAGVCPYTWTRDLNVGASGADVKMLQMFLNANADTRVAATGAGSAGMETEYYGPATAAAVSKMQVMYRAEVLTPAGLVNPTGYFGPSTRAKANSLCVAAPVVTPGDDGDDDGDMTDDDGDMTLGGEASLDDATLDAADDDELEEGAEDAPIAEYNVNFVDGDASISRIDVKLDSGDSSDAWDVFESISLWVDGDMVAEKSADSKSDYQSDDMTLRMTGLDIVAMEDEELTIVIAATLQNSIDADDRDTYTVSVESMRFFDADGVATTESDPTNGDDTTFTVKEAGFDDELIVKTSSSDPDATTLKVEDDTKSDWYTVFVFDLDTDDSVNDITINEVPVTVTISTSTFANRVDDYELVIDGTTIDDLVGTASTSVNGLVTDLVFDVDGDVVIDAGDRVQAELKLRFKSLSSTFEGMTVQGSVTGAQADAIDAEGAEDLDGTQLSGAATGDAHTLRTQGVDVSLDTTSAVVTTGDSAGDDYATYKIVLEVTAFEQDVYIDTDETNSVVASVVNSGGSAVTGTSTVIIDSSADVEGSSFKIAEGETETVTITVTFDAASAGAAARLQLTSLVFGETDAANNQTWSAVPASDYRTDIVTLVN